MALVWTILWPGWSSLWPNVEASIICWGIPTGVLWVWKIRPHLRAQRAHRTAAAAHRAHVEAQLQALHDKHHELHQAVVDLRDQP